MEETVREIEERSLVDLKAQLCGAADRYAGLWARWALAAGG